ncbi:MAG: hypothetical protein HKN42_10590 [Granulosicoccus sp.]|nr:hypothetical protein [Granulosicoccus sp.]
MTLLIFKYCLPALLGYTLFVGLAGRLNPFTKPFYVEERPSWLLGLWTGLTVSLVLGMGLHMAYGMSLEGARTLLGPTALFMGALLTPGFVGYFIYRRHVHRELATAGQVYLPDLSAETGTVDAHLAGPALSTCEPDAIDLNLADSLDDTVFEEFHYTLDELDATAASDEADPVTGTELETGESPDAVITAPETAADVQAATPEPAMEREQESFHATAELEARLLDEQASHEETAKHLRITRKALSVLESESRDYESRKADAVIRLEEKLARSINRLTTYESNAAREQEKRIELEQTVVNIKQNLVKAKQEVRRSTAARAKALSTANKSIAFARQAIQTRAQLEAEVEQIRDALANRQATISSLIRELEREKSRTQEDISTMARQLVLHEKQVRARRSLEEVARSVENKLSSRLVKKVAKARPLISDL